MDSLREVDDVAGAAQYIDNCPNTQSYHVCKYITSAGWVFPGRVRFSQWFATQFGVYPPREMLIKLGTMSRAERQKDTWFDLYMWETTQTKGR